MQQCKIPKAFEWYSKAFLFYTMTYLNKEANVKGWFKKERVTPNWSGNRFNMFDGCKLDTLELNEIILQSSEDCEALIEFLNVHAKCFTK